MTPHSSVNIQTTQPFKFGSIIVVLSVLSLIFFDLLTKGIGVRISIGDLVIIPLFLVVAHLMAKGIIRVPSRFWLASMSIIGLLLLKLMITAGEDSQEIWRDLQLVWRFMYLPLLILVLRDPRMFRTLYSTLSYSVIFLAVVALIELALYTGAGIVLFHYTNARIIGFFRQVSTFFYEPAVFSQFFVMCLFVLFPYSDITWKKKFAFISAFVAIALSQSLGGYFGIVCWLAYNLYNFFISRKGTSVFPIFLIISLIFVIGMVALGNESRISRFFASDSFESSGSGGRRVTVELIALDEFLSHSSFDKILIGLSSSEARNIRASRHLVVADDDVAGNGVIEFIFRFGILGLLLLIFFISVSCPNLKASAGAFLFLMLISQIDGAIAKPWTFSYLAIFISSLHFLYAKDPHPRLEQEATLG